MSPGGQVEHGVEWQQQPSFHKTQDKYPLEREVYLCYVLQWNVSVCVTVLHVAQRHGKETKFAMALGVEPGLIVPKATLKYSLHQNEHACTYSKSSYYLGQDKTILVHTYTWDLVWGTCTQNPAVRTPTIAPMNDQIMEWTEKGIRVTFLGSTEKEP